MQTNCFCQGASGLRETPRFRLVDTGWLFTPHGLLCDGLAWVFYRSWKIFARAGRIFEEAAGIFARTVPRHPRIRPAVNNPQTNKSTMYATVQALCEEAREVVWKDHAAFARHFADFATEAEAIQAWKQV